MNFKNWILIKESKEIITGLGYPETIARLFYIDFPKHATLIARWFKEYYNGKNDNWFRQIRPINGSENSLYELAYFYDSTFNKDNYIKALKYFDMDYEDEENYSDYDLEDQRKELLEELKDMFSKNTFFRNVVIQDIKSGKLTNLAPYKKMTFHEASDKYDKQRVFKETKPLKTYPNGYKWINVGPKCGLLGTQMKNCGSAGLMSYDKDKTILALFSKGNKPHVMVTYSPNEKRISGDQGAASTEVKEKYHDYILDLATVLNAEFDYVKSKSDLLKLKYKFKGLISNIEIIDSDIYKKIYKFNKQTQVFYTDGNWIISEIDAKKVADLKQIKNFKSALKSMFLLPIYEKESLLQNGIHFVKLNDFS